MIYLLIHIFYVLLFCVTTVQSAVAISLRILLWRNSLIATIFFLVNGSYSRRNDCPHPILDFSSAPCL